MYASRKNICHRFVTGAKVLGWIYVVYVTNFDCFCLRFLLHDITGPKYFADITMVNDQQCTTYKEACEHKWKHYWLGC